MGIGGSAVFYTLLIAWLALGLITAGHATMYKRDPRSAGLWVLISFALPLIGPWLYWVMGINRVQRRAARIKGDRSRPFAVPERALAAHAADIGHLGSLRRATDRMTRLPLLPGNTIVPLHNGEQTYPAMLSAIEAAERSVTLASYIFDWDEIGQRFCDALADAAKRGVYVHILLDGIGALYSRSRVGRQLLKAGARVAPFYPLRFPWGRLRINLRNHRKILVVDGRTGFTGGINISKRHLLESQDRSRVEDLHFLVTGPVVAEMQYIFAEDWLHAAEESLSGEAYFPRLTETGPAICRGIAGGPDEDFEKIHWVVLAALTAAQHSVRIATSYFIPTSALILALSLAALRGVAVTLLLPSHLDLPALRWAVDAYLWQLVEDGVRVVYRPEPFVHTKLMIVDERWLFFGSANLDPRSFRLNFEFNVEAYDAHLGGRMSKWLDGLADQSQPMTLEDLDARSIPRRLRDGFVKLFSPYL